MSWQKVFQNTNGDLLIKICLVKSAEQRKVLAGGFADCGTSVQNGINPLSVTKSHVMGICNHVRGQIIEMTVKCGLRFVQVQKTVVEISPGQRTKTRLISRGSKHSNRQLV